MVCSTQQPEGCRGCLPDDDGEEARRAIDKVIDASSTSLPATFNRRHLWGASAQTSHYQHGVQVLFGGGQGQQDPTEC